jgi:YggT family protein
MDLISGAVLVVIEVMKYSIFISVLMSWIPQAKDSKFAEVLRQLTEPLLGPVRKLTSKAMGGKPMMLDFSPLIAIVLLELIGGIISRIFR